MVDEKEGRTCSQCGDYLRIDEFRFKNRRTDKKHLVCFDCEPEGGFVTVLIGSSDEKVVGKKVIKKNGAAALRKVSLAREKPRAVRQKVEKGENECGVTTNMFRKRKKSEPNELLEHFQMLASCCREISDQIELTTRGKHESVLNGKANLASAKITQAIKLLS